MSYIRTPEIREKTRLSSLGKHFYKHTDEAKRKISVSMLGKKNSLGHKQTYEHKLNISIGNKGKRLGIKLTENTKNKLSKIRKGKRPSVNTEFKNGHWQGDSHPQWKGGAETFSKRLKLYNLRRTSFGRPDLFVIQKIYEDNIKKFGTLTCYLCLIPIEFGMDQLEHKTPLSRGGNNEYDNLEIACAACNRKKNSKTEEEYRKVCTL